MKSIELAAVVLAFALLVAAGVAAQPAAPPAAARPAAMIPTVPGMPPVVDPANLYSETTAATTTKPRRLDRTGGLTIYRAAWFPGAGWPLRAISITSASSPVS